MESASGHHTPVSNPSGSRGEGKQRSRRTTLYPGYSVVDALYGRWAAPSWYNVGTWWRKRLWM